MNNGVFSSLSQSYFQASKNVYYYVSHSHWLLKPITFLLAIIFSFILLPVGLVFWVLIFLDHLGSTTDGIRKSIINSMDNHSWRISDSFMSFLFRPIALVLTAPFFILSLAIPKVSSDAMLNVAADELSEIISGAGAFKRLNGIIWNAANRLFVYVGNAPLLLKPIAAVIAIIYSLILIILGALFMLLIPLDWISQIIENIRQGVVRFVDTKKENIKYDGSAFLFTPTILVILSPLFLAAILIPKFATQIIDTDVS